MKVAIAGFGVEGRASLDYWRGLGAEVVIADERDSLEGAPGDVEQLLGEDAFAKLDAYDTIIRSPSIHPNRLPYGNRVWSATNEFFDKCPCPIIGVTGTKGKGTTCSLAASILRAGGYTVHLVGNIGIPALEILPIVRPSDIVVFELSSFQLWDIKKSPHVAVVLMIEPDHMDVHSNFEEYIDAKTNIVRFQDKHDIVVYNQFNQQSASIANQSLANKLPYPELAEEFKASLLIPGIHNQENASAAISAVREYGIDDDLIRHGLENFPGLPHRLKFVTEKNEIKYYDDSIATTPGSAIAAMHSFSEPKILLLGGSDKGADYEDVVSVAKSTATRVLAIGQTGERIKELCDQQGVYVEREEAGMQNVVEHAASMAEPGDVVILSPASASFDQYKSYADRGEQFVGAVSKL